jgi:hypothetical protein
MRAGAFALLLLGWPLAATADSGRPRFTFEVGTAVGARAGSGTDDSFVGGPSLGLGLHLGALSLGVEYRFLLSRSFAGAGFDVGPFAAYDILHVALDSAISLGLFARVDVLLRSVNSLSAVGVVPLGSVGIRAAGLSLALGAGPEIGLKIAGNEPLGVSGELRLGFDVMEFQSYCARRSEEDRDPPE